MARGTARAMACAVPTTWALPRPSAPPGGALGQESTMRRSVAAVPRPTVHRAAYCLAVRRVPAGGGLRGRADMSSRLSWWSLAWGSDARHGGALAVAADGEARKSRCSRRAHAGWCPHDNPSGLPDLRRGSNLQVCVSKSQSLPISGWGRQGQQHPQPGPGEQSTFQIHPFPRVCTSASYLQATG